MGQNESGNFADSNYGSSFPKSQSTPQMAKNQYVSIDNFQDTYQQSSFKKVNNNPSKTTNSYSSDDHCADYVSNSNVTNTSDGYYGIWSRTSISHANGPALRVGHFTCYDCVGHDHYVYIGLGADLRTRKLFNDVWKYHIESDTWKILNVKLDPKSGSRATIVKNINSESSKHLLIFGGFANKKYFNDIILVDLNEIEKLEQIANENRIAKMKNRNQANQLVVDEDDSQSNIVKFLVAKNDDLRPSPRSTPVLANYKNKLFIWGGFNGKYPSEFNILDLTTLKWRKEENPVPLKGRTGLAYYIEGSKVYIYGGSNDLKPQQTKNIDTGIHSSSSFNNLRSCSDFQDEYDHLFIYDIETETMQSIKTFGYKPEPNLMGAGMVKVDDYLVFLGGRKTSSQFTLKSSTNIFALSLIDFTWRILTVLPDGITTQLNDGFIGDDGSFQLPSIHSFSIAYNAKKRLLFTFLGQTSTGRMIEMNTLSIFQTLAENNLSHDMKEMLCF